MTQKPTNSVNDSDLGLTWRDTITGYEGVAVGRTVWLHGCDRLVLQRMHDGKIDEEWFDVLRLELVPTAVDVAGVQQDSGRGGPQRDPSSRTAGR